MKKTVILAALLTSASLSADEAAPASSYSITVDVPYTTKYVFRGVSYADDAMQPSVKLTVGDFYAGIWGSAPLDKGFELEIDYYLGYGVKLNDTWSLDLGATLYSYPGLNGAGVDKTTFEPYAGFNGSFGGVTSGTYFYYDTTLDVFTAQQSFGYSIPIDEKTSLNFAATLGHANPDAGSDYTYYGAGLTLPYKLSDQATLTLGAQYASHDLDGVEDDHFWGTVGITYTF
ncbi:MAG: TorF family putative porin [Verrucomicrobiota bacterium]